MLCEELPLCLVCDSTRLFPVRSPDEAHSYRAGGAFLGGHVEQSFTCEVCQAHLVYFSFGREGETITFFPRGSKDEVEYAEYNKWVNEVLLPTYRDFRERVEAFRHKEWVTWQAEVFYPAFPDCTDYVPSGKRTLRDLPQEAQLMIRQTWGEFDKTGVYLPLPEELKGPVYPPQIPNLPMMWRNRNGSWERVSMVKSAAITPPEDPILRHNREFFSAVWEQLAQNMGDEQEVPSPIEVKNGYGGIQPWYQFTLNDAVFKVGWRKRVVSIQVVAKKGFNSDEIFALSESDNVTYEAGSPPRILSLDEYVSQLREELEGNKDAAHLLGKLTEIFKNSHPDGEITRDRVKGGLAHSVLIHAWGKDKTVEYLTTLCRAVLSTT